MHSNIVLVTTSALMLGAGIMVGRMSAMMPHQHHPGSREWIDEQLDLTAQQKSAMDAIWQQARQKMKKDFDSGHALEGKREQSIEAILTPRQQTEFEKINNDFHAGRETLFKQRTELINDANAQSRALLGPDQQKKWDALTEQMRQHHGPPPGGPGGGLGMPPPDGHGPPHDPEGGPPTRPDDSPDWH